MLTKFSTKLALTLSSLICLWVQIVSTLAHKSMRGYEPFTFNELDMNCGQVPFYQKLYGSSINGSLAKNKDIDDGDFRILHGLDAVPGEWPWIVKLSHCASGENCMICTGTLLNSRWIISAGHCGINFAKVNYTVTIGQYDLIEPDSTAFDVEVDKLVLHPDYDDLNNDLVLLRLKEPVKFNDDVQAACLIEPTVSLEAYAKDKICYTVGYGLTESEVSAVKLQKLAIEVKSPSDCNNDKLGAVQLRTGTVCIGPKEDIGATCKGDSGGPDLCYDTNIGGRWVLIGTVSYGPRVCDRDENDKWLTVSVDLASFRRWILATIAINS